DGIAQSFKQRIGSEAREVICRIEPAGFRALESGPISNSSCRRTVAVNPVCPCAEHRDVFSGDAFRAGECKLLVATTNAAVRHFDGNFSARNQTHAFGVLSHLMQASEKIIGCANVIPIIATAINLDCEPVPLRLRLCRLQKRGTRQQPPPATTLE